MVNLFYSILLTLYSASTEGLQQHVYRDDELITVTSSNTYPWQDASFLQQAQH